MLLSLLVEYSLKWFSYIPQGSRQFNHSREIIHGLRRNILNGPLLCNFLSPVRRLPHYLDDWCSAVVTLPYAPRGYFHLLALRRILLGPLSPYYILFALKMLFLKVFMPFLRKCIIPSKVIGIPYKVCCLDHLSCDFASFSRGSHFKCLALVSNLI